MRPKNESARDQLPGLLRRHPGAKAAKLATLAQVSKPTMLRMLKDAPADVVRVGKAGTTCYFLRRSLMGLAHDVPVYAVDSVGQATQVGALKLLEPRGTFMDVASMGWPVDPEFALGVWPHGLPYPLQDMRPQGFLGRQFAHREATTLGVSDNPKHWSDNDALHILIQKGVDTSGNLILGDTALQLWLDAKTRPVRALTADTIAQAYVDLATVASEGGIAGSSAAGEFPKFTALRDAPGAQTAHVLVKFSAADASNTVRRWSDLLVCEHLALEAIRAIPGIRSARSRIIQSQGRTFLEVERFDRHGLHGRSALCCLDTIEASILTQTSTDWGSAGELLFRQGWLERDAVEQLRTISAFGKLIANTDMHKGNLSFVPGPTMTVAPVYDMLPMQYAPLAGGEISNRVFAPGLPMPTERSPWLLASGCARAFWQSAADDERISHPFREICRQNALILERLQEMA